MAATYHPAVKYRHVVRVAGQHRPVKSTWFESSKPARVLTQEAKAGLAESRAFSLTLPNGDGAVFNVAHVVSVVIERWVDRADSDYAADTDYAADGQDDEL